MPAGEGVALQILVKIKFNAIFYDIKLPTESIARPISQADEQTQQQ